MIALLVAPDDHVYYGDGGGDLVQQHPPPSPSCPAWEPPPRPEQDPASHTTSTTKEEEEATTTTTMMLESVPLTRKKNETIEIRHRDKNEDYDDDEEQDGRHIIHIEQSSHYPPPVMATNKRTPSSVSVSFIDDFTIYEDTNNPTIEEDDDSSSSSSSSSSSWTNIRTSSTATTQCHDILHIAEYTADEIAECWYTRAEYFAIREDMKVELNYFYSAAASNSAEADEAADDYCHRGLERRTALAKTLRQTTRAQAIRAVVSEGQCQQYHGYTNLQMLADVYREYSVPAALLARTLGEQDARDAQRTYGKSTARGDDTLAYYNII